MALANSGRGQAAVTAIIALGAFLFLVGGVWSFGWPDNFYSTIATYPPYNMHLFHDIGAFQLGIGATLAAGLRWKDGPLVALIGASVGAAAHAIAHVLDRDLGGRASDPYLLTVLAIVLISGAALRARAVQSR